MVLTCIHRNERVWACLYLDLDQVMGSLTSSFRTPHELNLI